MLRQQTLAESERDKAELMLADMLVYLAEHEEAHTPFMEHWFNLCVRLNTCVYPAKLQGAKPGRRLRHGTPARVVECIESAARFGRPDIWFIRAIA